MARTSRRRIIGLFTLTVLVVGSMAARQLAAAGRSDLAGNQTDVVAPELADVERLLGETLRQNATTPTSSGLDLVARLQLTRGRITGDAASYDGASQAVRRSLVIAPRVAETRVLDAEVRYANHDFLGALMAARALVLDDPSQLGALAVEADALRELGRYDEAATVLDRLDRAAPGSSAVTVRRARLAYLHGAVNRADSLAALAERQAAESGLLGTTLAFYPAFRGQLALDRGQASAAEQHFRRALSIAPGDRVATVGLARALAERGRTSDAVRLVRALTNRYPDPAAFSLLGDLLEARGDRDGAKRTYDLVDAVAGLARANQQIYNRERVLFDANHGRRVDEAVRLARAENAVRKDVHGWDALAWAEYHAGNLDAAAAASSKALALGTPDASFRYHAGMIAAARGERERARDLLREALALNPRFDVRQAPIARAALARLG